MKKKKSEQILKASNMEIEYASLGDKNIRTFKKSETIRLIQLRTDHFLSATKKKARGNQMVDACTFYKKEAIIRDYFMTKCTILKKQNLDLLRMQARQVKDNQM